MGADGALMVNNSVWVSRHDSGNCWVVGAEPCAECRLSFAVGVESDLYRPDIEQIESRHIHALVLEQFGLDVEPAAIAAKRTA